MFDDPAESSLTVQSSPAALSFKAEVCRALAETSDSPERKALWFKRAEYWGELAFKASERLLESVKTTASMDC